MGYYRGDLQGFRGDYYRGDYYRGDPGLFSFLGKALGGVAKIAGGFLGGGPAGAVKAGVSLIRGGQSVPAITPPQLPMLPFGPTLPGGNVYNGGGASYGGSMYSSMIPTLTKGSLGPSGKRLHPNRSTYVTRGGGTSRWPPALQLHHKGEVLVGPRRMNVGNARALKRALRRAHGFAKLARRVMSLTHPGGRGRLTFKRKSTKRLRA